MFALSLIKLNMFVLDVTRRYFTLFPTRVNQRDYLLFEKLKENYSLKKELFVKKKCSLFLQT